MDGGARNKFGLPFRTTHAKAPPANAAGNRPTRTEGGGTVALGGQAAGQTVRAQSEQRGLGLGSLDDALLLFD